MVKSRLHICSTCQRDAPLATGEPSRGERLIGAVYEAIAQEHALSDALTVRQVHCLNGCLNPCNVSFRGDGKYTLRFSRLDEDDAKALGEFAVLYTSSDTGEIDDAAWPERLRGKLSARTPPRALLLGQAKEG